MPSINLRLTDEQHATLVASASAAHRSMQGEIIHRLFAASEAIPGSPAYVGLPPPESHFKPDPKPTTAEKKRRR